MNTTKLVVEIRLEKNSGPYGVWTHDLCDTGRLISSTVSVVFVTARIASIYIHFFNCSAQIWFSYIYSHYSPLGRFIWIQHNDQLPVGLLAQLVKRCTGIAEVMDSNPVRTWIFFRPYSNYKFSSVHNCEDRFYIHFFNCSALIMIFIYL